MPNGIRLFKKGQRVIWRPGFYPRDVARFKKEYGKGPFKILQIKTVPPDECCCGGSITKTVEHRDYCQGRPHHTVVAHTQWVFIAVRNGFSRKIELHQFSAAWFIPAPQ